METKQQLEAKLSKLDELDLDAKEAQEFLKEDNQKFHAFAYSQIKKQGHITTTTTI